MLLLTQIGQVSVSCRADGNSCVSKVLDRAERNENITTRIKPFDYMGENDFFKGKKNSKFNHQRFVDNEYFSRSYSRIYSVLFS